MRHSAQRRSHLRPSSWIPGFPGKTKWRARRLVPGSDGCHCQTLFFRILAPRNLFLRHGATTPALRRPPAARYRTVSMTENLARISARRPWIVIALWLGAAVLALGIVDRQLDSALTTELGFIIDLQRGRVVDGQGHARRRGPGAAPQRSGAGPVGDADGGRPGVPGQGGGGNGRARRHRGRRWWPAGSTTT